MPCPDGETCQCVTFLLWCFGCGVLVMETSKSVAVAASRKVSGKRNKRTKNGFARKAVDLANLHERLTHRVGLIDKNEILAITGVSFPTIWVWMRENKFPHARVVVGKSKWHAADIADWLKGLPVRPLKAAATKHIEA